MTTWQAIKRWRYDYTALIGLLIGAAPELIDFLLSNPDAPVLSKNLRITLHLVGLGLAAWGRSVKVRE